MSEYILDADHNFISKQAEGLSTVQFINEKHLEPWLKMCTSNNLHNTPLTPYIDLEALNNKHLNVDSSKIRKEGFEFLHPKPTYQNLVEVRHQDSGKVLDCLKSGKDAYVFLSKKLINQNILIIFGWGYLLRKPKEESIWLG